MSMGFNKSKFQFSETFNNSNGKTSGSAFLGIILGLIAGLSFLGTMFGYFFNLPNTLEVMGEVLKLATAATILLGVRKVAGNFESKTEITEEKKQDNTVNDQRG